MRLPKAKGQVALAVGVIGLAAVVWHQTTAIPVSPIYARIGPTVFPTMVAAGLFVVGLMLLWQALRGGWQTEEDQDQSPVDWHALGWVLAGLVLNVALIKPFGFTLASVLLFACVAHGFGSTRPVRDAAVGFVLAGGTYFGFSRLLGLDIGTGLVERLF